MIFTQPENISPEEVGNVALLVDPMDEMGPGSSGPDANIISAMCLSGHDDHLVDYVLDAKIILTSDNVDRHTLKSNFPPDKSFRIFGKK